MSVIKAGTTVTTALVLEGNTDGDLIFKTGSAAVTAMSISASGVVTFPATTGFDISSANITNLTATTLTVSAATYLATASGNVGIGTSSPGVRLEIQTVGAGSVVDALSLYNPNSAGSAAGNRILFQNFNNANARTTYASIENILTGNSAGNEFGILTFSTKNAGSLAERVRIDQTGIVSIQTVGAGSLVDTLSLYNPSSAGGSAGNRIQFQNFNNANSRITYASIENYVDGNSATNEFGILTFSTRGSGTLTERVRITSGGSFLVGTTTSVGKMSVNTGDGVINLRNYADILGTGTGSLFDFLNSAGTSVVDGGIRATNLTLFGSGSTPMLFYTNGSERARITSGGDLAVGTTTGGQGRILAEKSSTNSDDPVIFASNPNTGATGVTAYVSSLGGAGSANNTNCFHLKAITQGSAVYYLYGNGTTSFTSDERLKKNIVTARDGYIDDVKNLRVVKYQWNTSADDSPTELGLIAQEVEQVFPGLVQEADTEIQGIKPKVVKASVLPYILLKAVQEQQAMINELKAKVAALEGV